jgi:hypothetical protein
MNEMNKFPSMRMMRTEMEAFEDKKSEKYCLTQKKKNKCKKVKEICKKTCEYCSEVGLLGLIRFGFFTSQD